MQYTSRLRIISGIVLVRLGVPGERGEYENEFETISNGRELDFTSLYPSIALTRNNNHANTVNVEPM